MSQIRHFVGFGRFDQRYWNAVKAFGPPAFLHQRWDRRARREIAVDDVVIFAKGCADQSISSYNGDDEFYIESPACAKALAAAPAPVVVSASRPRKG